MGQQAVVSGAKPPSSGAIQGWAGQFLHVAQCRHVGAAPGIAPTKPGRMWQRTAGTGPTGQPPHGALRNDGGTGLVHAAAR